MSKSSVAFCSYNILVEKTAKTNLLLSFFSWLIAPNQPLNPFFYLRAMLKQTLLKATEAGAAVLKHFFNGEFKISNKEGINNLVTEADHAAEKAIFEVIREEFPDHYLLSEEAGEIAQESSYKWIIDPIDGTVNFANGIPICAVSIGLEKDGEIVMGAVYNPILNEFFFAEKNNGATLNEKPISVSSKTEVGTSCLVTGFPYSYLDSRNGPLDVFATPYPQRYTSAASGQCSY